MKKKSIFVAIIMLMCIFSTGISQVDAEKNLENKNFETTKRYRWFGKTYGNTSFDMFLYGKHTDKGYIFAGEITNLTRKQYIVVTDFAGNITRELMIYHTLSGQSYYALTTCAVECQDGIIVGGWATAVPLGAYYGTLQKIRDDGTPEWYINFGDNTAVQAITRRHDDTLYVVVYQYWVGGFGWHCAVVYEITPTGLILSNSTYPLKVNNIYNASSHINQILYVTTKIMAGTYWQHDPNSNVVKIGVLLICGDTVRTFEVAGATDYTCAGIVYDGTYYYALYNVHFDTGPRIMLVRFFDVNNLQVFWVPVDPFESATVSSFMYSRIDNSFYMAGRSGDDAFLMKINFQFPSPTFTCEVLQISGRWNEEFKYTAHLPTGQLLLCGQTSSWGSGNYDGFVAVLDQHKNIIFDSAFNKSTMSFIRNMSVVSVSSPDIVSINSSLKLYFKSEFMTPVYVNCRNTAKTVATPHPNMPPQIDVLQMEYCSDEDCIYAQCVVYDYENDSCTVIAELSSARKKINITSSGTINGKYVFQTKNVGRGNYSVAVYAQDIYNMSSKSAPRELYLQKNTAPQIDVLTAQVLPDTDSVAISYSCSDLDEDPLTLRIYFGEHVFTTTNATGEVILNLNDFLWGALRVYEFTINVSDGFVEVSRTIPVVCNHPPLITITSVSTDETMLRAEWRIRDPDNDPLQIKVKLINLQNRLEYIFSENCTATGCAIYTVDCEKGLYECIVLADDGACATQTVFATVLINNKLPVFLAEIEANETCLIIDVFVVYDPDGDAVDMRVEVSNAQVKASFLLGVGENIIDTAAFIRDIYNITIVADDGYGGITTLTKFLALNNHRPELHIHEIRIIGDALLMVNCSMTDADPPDSDKLVCDVSFEREYVYFSTRITSGGIVYIPISEIPQGRYILTFTVRDPLAAFSTYTTMIEIPNHPPRIIVSTVNNGTHLAVSWNVSDIDMNLRTVNITVGTVQSTAPSGTIYVLITSKTLLLVNCTARDDYTTTTESFYITLNRMPQVLSCEVYIIQNKLVVESAVSDPDGDPLQMFITVIAQNLTLYSCRTPYTPRFEMDVSRFTRATLTVHICITDGEFAVSRTATIDIPNHPPICTIVVDGNAISWHLFDPDADPVYITIVVYDSTQKEIARYTFSALKYNFYLDLPAGRYYVNIIITDTHSEHAEMYIVEIEFPTTVAGVIIAICAAAGAGAIFMWRRRKKAKPPTEKMRPLFQNS